MNLEELYKVYPLYRDLFPEQLAFVLDPSRFVSALCSRRSGKTTVCAIDIVQQLLLNPGSLYLYLALTDKTVEDIFMPTIRPVLAKHRLNVQVNKDAIIFPNGSKLLLAGANHINKIETFRGFKLLGCDIDEAASFDDKILSYLIDEIIAPALLDKQGKLRIIGTPAAHCSGMFYEVTTGKFEDTWRVHTWTGLDNLYISENFRKDMELFKKRKKCDDNNPKFRREFLGEWCADDDELMIKPFAVSPDMNFTKQNWRTVIGVDIGFNDETAMTVVGWEYNNPKAYVLKSIGRSGMSVSDIAHMLQGLKEEYSPATIVMDPAGASRTLMEEFSRKYHIHVDAAKKTDKAHYIEIMNDALINHELMLVDKHTKELQQEMKKLVWNDDHTREKEGQKCDKVDATLYAYRAALHYLEQIPKRPEKIDNFALSRQMEEQAVARYREREEAKRPDKFYDDLAAMLDD